jgi:O-antigen/teichoic acid export membrane protein
MSKQIWKNISSGWMQIFLSLLFTMFITPIVVNTLGREMYGLWILIFNMVGYLYLADFGITNSISRLYSKYNILEDKKKLGSLIYTIYIIIILIDVLIIFLSFIFYKPIMIFLNIGDNFASIFTILFIIATIEVLIQMVLRVNIGILQGIHKFNITYNFNSINVFVKFILIYFLIYIEYFNIFTYTIVTSGTKLIVNMFSFYIIKTELSKINRKIDREIFKEMASLGSSSLIISLAISLYINVPILLFGKLFSIENVILYSIPMSLMLIVSKFINMIFVIMGPKVSELKALDSENKIYNISLLGINISLLINFLSIIFFIFFVEDILKLWLGDKELNLKDFIIMYNISILLMTSLMLENIQKINNIIYKSVGLHWLATWDIVISIGLLFVLVLFFYEIFGEYVFALSMVFVGGFRFLFYKYIGRDKISTASHSIFIIILHLIGLSVLYYYINNFMIVFYIKILLFLFIFIFYGSIYYLYIIKPLVKKIRFKEGE